ncbi:von Willebrand factor type A domain protein [Vibrio thalassae]|uniref:von Willebrand factor type A domain protein n=1 Tax=Vibrio thalassae TaxID=1243014 RepID=A0A240EH01_9VIBR|nr:VWA domain-containing protein [Vibrio thalassae]SNX47255.1 von Willebrand factor type A domain protein [Vibrio thalassae]
MRNLSKSIVIMSGVYANEFGIKIILNNKGKACTNGKEIHLPKPNLDCLDLTWGYAAHEAAHNRFTDFSINPQSLPRPVEHLLQTCEDTRIELEFIKLFPGCKKYFCALAEKVICLKDDHPLDSIDQVLSVYCFHYVRGKLTGYPNWDEQLEEIEKFLFQKLGISMMAGLTNLLNKAKSLESTQESLDLAREIVDYLQASEGNSDSSGDDEEDGQDSDSSDDGGENGQDSGSSDDGGEGGQDSGSSDDGGESGQDSGSSDDGGEDGQDSGSSGDGGENGQDSGSSDDGGESGQDCGSSGDGGENGQDSDSLDDADVGSQILKAFLSGDSGSYVESDTGALTAEFLSQDENQEAMTEVEMYDSGQGDIMNVDVSDITLKSFEANAVHATSSLRQGLLRLIQDQTRTQKIVTKRGRRLAKGKLHRLTCGNTRIFKRKFSERENVDVDVVVLADSSGSMNTNIEHMKVATYAILDALERIDGANTAAYAFGYGSTDIAQIKKPNERFSNIVKGKIATLQSWGGTPAAEAYWAAAHALFAMQGKKKVVVMITDGQPNSPSATKEMVKALQSEGITVICMGVGCGAIKARKIFNDVYGHNRWLVVEDFEDLPSELLRVAKEVI